METLTISPRFQVIIPRRARELLGLRPGQKLQAIVYDGRLELLPVRKAKDMRGFLKGIDTSIERGRDRT